MTFSIELAFFRLAAVLLVYFDHLGLVGTLSSYAVISQHLRASLLLLIGVKEAKFIENALLQDRIFVDMFDHVLVFPVSDQLRYN